MPGFATTLGVLILSGFISLSAANKDTCDFYAAVGQMLSLPFNYKDFNTDLSWTHNGTIIFYRHSGRVSVGKPDDITESGSLQLKNLNSSSAGIYKADILNKGLFVKGWTGRLCMMEKVSKPQVTFLCDSKASIITLTCNVAKLQGLFFTWALNKKDLTSETRQTLSISLTKLKGENNFTCGVANKVSKEMSDSIQLTCKAAPPTSFCFRPKTVMAMLAGGGCLILLLLIIIIILCCRHRQYMTLMSPERKHKLPAVPMLKLTQHQQPDPVSPEYETMHPTGASPAPSPKPLPIRVQAVSGTQAPESLSHTSRDTEGKRPSPVPKPRTKTPQTPGN